MMRKNLVQTDSYLRVQKALFLARVKRGENAEIKVNEMLNTLKKCGDENFDDSELEDINQETIKKYIKDFEEANRGDFANGYEEKFFDLDYYDCLKDYDGVIDNVEVLINKKETEFECRSDALMNDHDYKKRQTMEFDWDLANVHGEGSWNL